MRRATWIVILCLAVCMGCGGKQALDTSARPVRLAYGTLVDQFVRYKLSTSVNVTQAGIVETWLADIVFSAAVDSVDPDGSISRRLNYESFSLTTLEGGAAVPDADAAGYKGEYLWLKMDGQGGLVDWKGMDGVRKRTPDQRDLRQAIVQELLQMHQPFPSEEVTLGSTWQRSFDVEQRVSGGTMKVKATVDYSVAGFGTRAGRNCVKIETKITSSGEIPKAEGVRSWGTREGVGDGEIWFDYAGGLVVEYAARVTSSQELSFERAGKEDVTTQASTIDCETKIRMH